MFIVWSSMRLFTKSGSGASEQPKVLFAQNLLLTLTTAPLYTALVLTYTMVTHGINAVPVLEILDSDFSTKETDVLSAAAAVLKYWRNISVPLAASAGT